MAADPPDDDVPATEAIPEAEPDPVTPEGGVALAPSGSCVAMVADRPPEAGAEELRGLAELTLETHSPFPLEQLAWGYLPTGDHLRIFALPRNRFPAPFAEALPEARHAVPAAVPVLLNPDFRATPVLLQHADCLTLVPNDPSAPLRHQPLLDDTPERIRLAAARLGFADLNAPSSPPVLRGLRGQLLQGQVRFHAETDNADGGVTPIIWTVPSTDLWPADLREPAEVRRVQRELVLDAWANRSLLAWGAMAVVLLLLLVGWAALVWYKVQTDARVAELAPQFERVTNQQQIVQRLLNVAGEPFDPFLILERLNAVRPWETIWLSFFDVDDDNFVEVRGFAAEINPVNAYLEQLVETGYFEPLEEADFRRRDQNFEFIFRLRYLPDPASADAGSGTESSAS